MPLKFGAVLDRRSITKENLEKLKSLGFDGVELFIGEPSEQNVKPIAETVKPLLGDGFQVSDIFASGVDLVRVALDEFESVYIRCRQAFEAARLLETSIVLLPVFRTPPGVDRATVLAKASAALKRLDGLASEYGVRLALEPLNRYETNILKTMSETLRFLENLGCENVKTMADLYHMSIEEAWIPDALRLISGYLVHMHVSENHGGIPGTGTLPYPQVMRTLKEVGYDGFMSIEFHKGYPDVMEAYGRSLKYLKALADVV